MTLALGCLSTKSLIDGQLLALRNFSPFVINIAASDDLYCSIDQLPQYGAILFPFHAHQTIVYISFHI